jgi:hypothetical protein
MYGFHARPQILLDAGGQRVIDALKIKGLGVLGDIDV